MLVDNDEFIKKLMSNKMLTVKASENVIRLFPPLIVRNRKTGIDAVCSMA